MRYIRILFLVLPLFGVVSNVVAQKGGMHKNESGAWVNEKGGNIYGDSRFNMDADPRFNMNADPRFSPEGDPAYTSRKKK